MVSFVGMACLGGEFLAGGACLPLLVIAATSVTMSFRSSTQISFISKKSLKGSNSSCPEMIALTPWFGKGFRSTFGWLTGMIVPLSTKSWILFLRVQQFSVL